MYNSKTYNICIYPWNYDHNQGNEDIRYSQKFPCAPL